MDMKRFFLYAIVIAALALAGCGGNGGGMAGGTDPVDPPSCPAGQVGTPPNCVTPGPSVADLFTTAQNARDAADDAVKAATAAVKDATESSGKIGVVAVRGDSMTAQKNAQAVLDAKTAVTSAVTTAETAVSDLNQADKDADEHNNTALDNAIAAALTVAEQAVKDAKKQNASSTLQTAVETVTGTAKDKLTAADHAEAVAEAIEGALTSTDNNNGRPARVEFAADTTGRSTADADHEKDNHLGMTWAEIVGSANIMKMRIRSGVDTSGGIQTRVVDATSIAGMPARFASRDNTPTRNASADSSVDNGVEFIDASYKGIPGISFCAGKNCNVDTDGNLTGSWYFTPNGPKVWYIGTTADGQTTYSVENQFAKYGYWVSGSNTSATVHIYAIPGIGADETGTTPGTHYNLTTDNSNDPTATILTDTMATYSGKAIGLSVYNTYNTDGTVADGFPQSGEFTADVELTARFGSNASLGGKIMNFSGDAVGSNWAVTLRQEPFTGLIQESDGAVALGSSTRGGLWTATAFGTGETTTIGVNDVVSVRPSGIFGQFNAHFTNGSAAGAYATRKD